MGAHRRDRAAVRDVSDPDRPHHPTLRTQEDLKGIRLVIFGANGPTGRLLTRRLLDADHTVVAVTRRPATFPITDARLTVAEADVFQQQAVAGVLPGADAVLSVLGVPFTRRAV